MNPMLDGDGRTVRRGAVASVPSASADDSSSQAPDGLDHTALPGPADTGWPLLSGFELDVCLADGDPPPPRPSR